METPKDKLTRYEKALSLFVDRLKEDRWIVGAVLQSSLCEETIWKREKIHLWIIEADGVTRRCRFDDEEKQIYRTFIEEGIMIAAEVIPRSRFKRMIEGNSRTAFTCNFFARRILLYTTDASLDRWFKDANALAVKDQNTALWIAATWLIHSLKHIDRLVNIRKDIQRAREELLWPAWTLAAIEIIERGEICEGDFIHRGAELNPDLFQVVYVDVQSGAARKAKVSTALKRVHEHLGEKGMRWLKPLIQALRKKGRLTSLSELADDHAHTQVYPWHIETGCEWLTEQNVVSTFSAPFRLTKRSTTELEEPAYELQA